MKNIIAILFIITFGISAHTQTLVKENKLWACTKESSSAPGDYESYFIKFEGDTTISDLNYKKIWRSNDSLQTSWYIDGYIREDTSKKVFLYPINKEYVFNDNEEVLIYDFNLNIGDSIELPFNSEEYIYLKSIVYEKLENQTDSIMTFLFNSTTDMNGYEIAKWYERIGSKGGVLNGLNLTSIVGSYFSLVCYYENNILNYHNDNFTTCFPEGYPDAIYPISNKEFYNLFFENGELYFENHSNIMNPINLKIYNTFGQLIFSQKVKNKNFIKVDVNNFDNGIYIYRIELNKNIVAGKLVLQ